MDCIWPGFPVPHQLPELAQTHVHPVGDAIQPFHPVSSPSPAFNLSQYQDIFQCVSSSSRRWELYNWCVLDLVELLCGEGNGTPLQFSCLENPMDGGAWWAAVHGVAKSPTRLSDFTFTFHFHALEKEMATHSSVLAWRIPGTAEPGGLPSMGSHRVGHD